MLVIWDIGRKQKMRFSIGFALLGLALAGSTLTACAGPEGNPNGQPYANEAGGAIAVKPEVLGMDNYNPYAEAKPFADMQAGQVAITPAPTPPLNLTPLGAMPAPQRPAPMPH
jgi:hypothetical protein